MVELKDFGSSISDTIGDIMESYFSKISSGQIINKEVKTEQVENDQGLKV